MKKFIVFSTLSQAKNYIKRNLSKCDYSEGCGCCYDYYFPLIKGKRILYVHHNSYADNLTVNVTVIGRYKR
jgi:hypothetical protein